MKLVSNLRLRLSETQYVITIVSRTYEKASMDQYLAASISLRCEKKIYEDSYIDNLTGKGSMNPHLKKMVAKADEMSKEQKESILTSSLYPIEKVDESQRFVYLEQFGVSVFEGNVYNGNLSEQEKLLKSLIHYDGTLVSVKTKSLETANKEDNFRVTIDDEEAVIDIGLKGKAKASQSLFKEIVIQDVQPSPQNQEIMKTDVSGDGWNLLTNSQLNGPMKSLMGFYGNKTDKNYYLLTNDGIKRTELGEAFGLYLYRDSSISFLPENSDVCETAAQFLLSSKKINEYKTKSLIELLSVVSAKTALDCANFILSIKDSRDIAVFALNMLKKGTVKGWTDESLSQMKLFADQKSLEIIYGINKSLFTLQDMLTMDKTILVPGDRAKVVKHEKERNAQIDFIKDVNGEVTIKALREQSGKLKSNDDVKEFRDLVKKLIAHSKESLLDASDDHINSVYRLAKRLKGLIPSIEKQISEQGANK